MQDEPSESPPLDDKPALSADPAPTNLPLPNDPPTDPEPNEPAIETAASPAWAEDLRKLYDAVVEEPLPASLIDLLSQLDSKD